MIIAVLIQRVRVHTSINRKVDKHAGVFTQSNTLQQQKKILIIQTCKNVKNMTLSKTSLMHLIPMY